MNTRRKLLFATFFLTALVCVEARLAAFDWPWEGADRPTTENGCTVTENALDIYSWHDFECPYVRYDASCPWFDGCGEAFFAAEDVCNWWGNETGHQYLVVDFSCDDDQDPTDFTFECDPVFPYLCYVPTP